ncbi:MAG: pirin family protein [Chitinophagaceae bacterium]|nr:pirin family protein [Chitinophagaceae bacterium]
MKKSIEKIIQRPASPGMVGDGFRVFHYIPGTDISQRRISPFLVLDFNAAYDFGPSKKVKGVGVHPHKGFETVTIAYKGSVAHHDSAGNSGVIRPGDVQWMTAGSGILHKEYHEEEFSKQGGPFEMVQLWVNLPQKHKLTAPHYQAITASQMGKAQLPDNQGIVNVIAGNFNGISGPAATYTPANLLDIKLNRDGALVAKIPATHNTALLVINGSIAVNDEKTAEHSFVLFNNDGEDIELRALENSVILLLSGEPIQEPIASYGPFVMNTEEEIYEAIQEFQTGKFGVLS